MSQIEIFSDQQCLVTCCDELVTIKYCSLESNAKEILKGLPGIPRVSSFYSRTSCKTLSNGSRMPKNLAFTSNDLLLAKPA